MENAVIERVSRVTALQKKVNQNPFYVPSARTAETHSPVPPFL
jgi:hypothetical protein